MQLDEVLRRRRMTRSFSSTPVDAARLERLLDQGRRVPSAGYAQAVELLVLTEEARRRCFWELASDDSWRRLSSQAPGLLAAPVVVLPVVDPAAYGARYREPDKATSALARLEPALWPAPFWIVDAAFSVLALLLAAENDGLGALFSALHGDGESVLCGLGVPAGHQAIGAVLIGERDPTERPSGSPLRRRRRALSEVVHREGW